MSDATQPHPATPTPAPSTTGSSWWSRIGGTIGAPLRTFHGLVDERLVAPGRSTLTREASSHSGATLRDDRGGAHPAEPLLVYAVVVLAIAAPEVYRLLALAGEAPLIVLNRLLDVVLRAGRTDLSVVAGAAVVVGLVGRALGKSFVSTAIATTYLLVPLAVLKAIGGLTALGGLELWWLPQRAVDSFAVVVNNRVDVTRFIVKCAVSFVPGLCVLLWWLRARGRSLPPPTVLGASSGIAVVAVVVGGLLIGSTVQVAARSEQLRPRLVGDDFPSLALRRLETRTRIDIVELAKAERTRVVVVDFWASWCAPCRRSLPELGKLAERWKFRGVVVVGVNREPGDLDAAKKAWRDLALDFMTLVDDRGLGERVGLTSLPSSFILDHTGKIRHLHLGYTEPAVIAAEVEALLLESP